MAHIRVHDLSARAATRPGRLTQIAALTPTPRTPQRGAWQLNRRAIAHQRDPRAYATDYQPWLAQADQNIVLGLRGVPNTTNTTTRRIPFAAVIRECVVTLSNDVVLGTFEWNVESSDYGLIWSNNDQTPQVLVATAGADVIAWSSDPRVIIATPGSALTIRLVTPQLADAHLSVRVQPLHQFLRSPN